MRRREYNTVATVIAAAFLYSPLGHVPAIAGETGHIGMLCLSRCPVSLVEALREIGNSASPPSDLHVLEADGRFERLAELAAEHVNRQVRLIVTQGGMPTALAARAKTRSIPILVTDVGDAVGFGLATSLAKPGGNVTGMSFLGPELISKQLELLKDTLPNVVKVAMIVDGRSPAWHVLRQDALAAAAKLDLRLTFLPIDGPDDLERVLQAIGAAKPDALYLSPDNLIAQLRSGLSRYAIEQRLATMASSGPLARSGALLSLYPDWDVLYRRSANLAQRILQGQSPDEIPFEQPTAFQLVINQKTAKALGIAVPESIIARADEVIE